MPQIVRVYTSSGVYTQALLKRRRLRQRCYAESEPSVAAMRRLAIDRCRLRQLLPGTDRRLYQQRQLLQIP